MYSKRVRMYDRPSLPSDLKSTGRNVKLWDCQNDNPIYSGHVIEMTTQDPESFPLPSFDLLHMQWVMNRVAAISGAADISDEDDSDDESEAEPSSDAFTLVDE
ncbi:hypothetical protein FE257_011429 [Aspergillus nanangensis]|uniref:Uncharacterized protein n=1 Tax=Aspergillus nanangensis TaxID=2582783 RepID=A0AAD4CHP4_ASPNN|nr:hypothetical protein FE257_011429 [Aspergillus nanangensis]